jgi:hypothetical protein
MNQPASDKCLDDLSTLTACPKCGGRDLVDRLVLDERLTRGRACEPKPDLWLHFRCCDKCRVTWIAAVSDGDDLGVMDSERNFETLLNGKYSIFEFAGVAPEDRRSDEARMRDALEGALADLTREGKLERLANGAYRLTVAGREQLSAMFGVPFPEGGRDVHWGRRRSK